MSDLQRVTTEIEALHAFFVEWFTGGVTADDVAFDEGLPARLDSDFLIVQPNGEQLSGPTIAKGIRAAHSGSAGFRIAIRNVRVLRRIEDVLVVMYEEWQVNARFSSPPSNGRLATALFRDEGERLTWLHIHETWLPDAVMAAGPYDF